MPSKPFGLAVKAVIVDEHQRTLLLRRSGTNTHFAGQWEWPGGKVEPGEDFAAATVREMAEEIGLGIELTGLAGATSFELDRVRVVLLCMRARITSGEPRLGAEHTEWRWVPLADLADLDLVTPHRDFMLSLAPTPSEASP